MSIELWLDDDYRNRKIRFEKGDRVCFSKDNKPPFKIVWGTVVSVSKDKKSYVVLDDETKKEYYIGYAYIFDNERVARMSYIDSYHDTKKFYDTIKSLGD